MSELEPVAAPFETRAQVMGFCALVVAVLALPFALHAAHTPAEQARLVATPTPAGPFSFIGQEIFEKSGDIDLLIVGDSVVWVGLDTVMIQRRLSQALGRPATVVTLGWPWPGHDLPWHVLRPLLQRRRVHHLVLRLWPGEMRVAPHPQSHRWLDASTDPVIAALPFTQRLTIHGIEVVGGLRNLLSVLRPDRTGPSLYAGTLGHRAQQAALPGRTFRRQQRPAPLLPVEAVLVDRPWPGDLRPFEGPLDPYQAGYAAGMRDLIALHGAAVTLVRFPARTEAHAAQFEVAGHWVALFGPRARILAPRPPALFQGLADADIDDLYYNDNYHLNANGSEYLTEALLPFLIAPNLEGHAP